MNNREALEEKIEYTFKDISILNEALTHKSFVNENKGEDFRDNERLEFLGDSVLGLIVSELLFKAYPSKKEGELSKIRASIVREESLAPVAREIGLGACLQLGKGEELSGGRDKSSILADAMESLIAAVYLDSGFKAAERLIRKLFGSLISTSPIIMDYKSEVQELSQSRGLGVPSYETLSEEGPDHDRCFEVALILNGKSIAKGRGRSLKEAQKAAAKTAFDCLKEEK